jgi:hypothetical protein
MLDVEMSIGSLASHPLPMFGSALDFGSFEISRFSLLPQSHPACVQLLPTPLF